MADYMPFVSLVGYDTNISVTSFTDSNLIINKNYVDGLWGLSEWTEKASGYVKNALVVYEGKIYKNVQDGSNNTNTPGERNSNWQEVTLGTVLSGAAATVDTITPTSGKGISADGSTGVIDINLYKTTVGDVANVNQSGLVFVGDNDAFIKINAGNGLTITSNNELTLSVDTDSFDTSTGVLKLKSLNIANVYTLSGSSRGLRLSNPTSGTISNKIGQGDVVVEAVTPVPTNWLIQQHYDVDAIVLRSGDYYQCIKDNDSTVTNDPINDEDQEYWVAIEYDPSAPYTMYTPWMYVGPVTNGLATDTNLRNADNWVQIQYNGAVQVNLSTSNTIATDVTDSNDTYAVTPAALSTYTEDLFTHVADNNLHVPSFSDADDGQILTVSVTSSNGEETRTLSWSDPADVSGQIATYTDANFLSSSDTVTVWDENATYNNGNIVAYETKLYRATTTTNEVPGSPSDSSHADDWYEIEYAPLASNTSYGFIKVGTGLAVSDGVVSVSTNYATITGNRATYGSDSLSEITKFTTPAYVTSVVGFGIISFSTSTNTARSYETNQVVQFNNKYYRCKEGYTLASGATDYAPDTVNGRIHWAETSVKEYVDAVTSSVSQSVAQSAQSIAQSVQAASGRYVTINADSNNTYTIWTFDHDLETDRLLIQVYDTDGNLVLVETKAFTDTNDNNKHKITIQFAVAPKSAYYVSFSRMGQELTKQFTH